MTGLSILLPWPPSTNDLWRAVKLRGNIMSARYRDWVREAELALAVQPHHAVEGPVAIRLQLCPPTNRAYDPDNFIKAVIDFLHGRDLIDGDSNKTVRRIIVECDEGFNGVWAHIDPVAP
jgi:Holliday junction resolvase RusA-like endonuclease